jgi:hypothetical protein
MGIAMAQNREMQHAPALEGRRPDIIKRNRYE